MTRRVVVSRTDLSDASISEEPDLDLQQGEVRLRVDLFGLSANNITYALFGDALGYWGHFPVDDGRGCIPVWGFADVVESRSELLTAGERVFGYLPMADGFVLTPAEPTELGFSDASPHRAELHPWYARYYRCSADPLWAASGEELQVSLWALFMTGWGLAGQLAETANTVVVSSASSKTALALAWALRDHPNDVTVVGVTSDNNAAFVASTDGYDGVTTYDNLGLSGVTGPVAFVDAAGSPAIKEAVHAALGGRLTDSVILGATHQGGGAAGGSLGGPAPRFFFIPDVADQTAAELGHAAYHQTFADAWRRFVPWIEDKLEVTSGQGPEGIVDAYRTVLAGGLGPEVATVLRW
ncbi:MAG: DUF2855 family protein [Actinomycetota bacterium]